MNEFDVFDSYEGDYQPKTGFAPDVKTLPPGKQHDFIFVSAAIKTVEGKTLIEAVVKCLTPGLDGEYQHAWWVQTAQKFNFFAGDLLKLGFDSDKWGPAHGRPLSVEVPRAVARLAGVRFRAMNTVRDTKEGTFTDFRIFGKSVTPRLSPPSTPAANNGVPGSNNTHAAIDDDSIPF